MQGWQSLAGSEVRVSVRSATVQGQPGFLVPSKWVQVDQESLWAPSLNHGDLGGTA